MPLLPYQLAVQRFAQKHSLDQQLLTELSQTPEQNPHNPITYEQTCVLDAIRINYNQDVPTRTAVNYVLDQYHAKNIMIPSIKPEDLIPKVQTYYAIAHMYELQEPMTKRVIKIFKHEKKRELEQVSGIKFRKFPRITHLIILRAIKRDMANLKFMSLDMAMDKDIRDTINHEQSTIWDDLGYVKT